jgi:phosphate ABC transporter phosphate-binding protein
MKWKRSALFLLTPLLIAAALSVAQTTAPQNQIQNLGSIHTIFVAPVEGGSSADAVGKRIADQLEKAGKVRIAADPASADAVLHATASIWATGTVSPNPRSHTTRATNYQGYLSAELVGKGHQTLWSYMVTPSRSRNATLSDDLADQLASRLLAAIRSGIAYPSAVSSTPSATRVTLHAAGSTFAAPLYLKWFESYAQDPAGTVILYDPIGSEAGIEQLKAGAIDIAGSDIPLPAQSSILHFPTVLGGVVPIYNLPSLDGRTLNLTPEALAGIYSGAVRKWNDPRIREANHGLRLPDAEIAVANRSDGSGTAYIWSSFLSQVSPEWKSQYGSGPRIHWPIGTGASGNEGVAQLVAKTANAIGYVELTYAVQNRLSYAAVRNPAGQFIKADLDSITAAAPETIPIHDLDAGLSILNAPGRNAYPISTFTWLLVPVEQADAQKQAATAEFLRWMLTSGQKQCEALGYAPLPRRIVAREIDEVNAHK